MTLDSGFLWAFVLVFVRASAMLLSSPVFGAQSTPIHVRVMTTLSVGAAVTMAVRPHVGPLPADLLALATALANEAVAGLLIGLVMTLIFQGFQMAGALADFQIGLGSSQILNPISGVPVTIIAQMKFMLALVVFLTIDGHHAMIHAFVRSYEAMPALGLGSLERLQAELLPLFGHVSLLALQIAAPVAAVSLIVDAGLGLVNKAVPQMQVLIVGMPAKVLVGFIALSLTLPAIVAGVEGGVQHGLDLLWRLGR